MSIEASYRKTGNAASVNVCLSLYTSCKICTRNGRGRDIAPLRRVRVRPEMLGHRTRDIGSHTSHNPNNAHVAAGRIDMESPQRFSVGSISMNQSMPPNKLKVSLRNPKKTLSFSTFYQKPRKRQRRFRLYEVKRHRTNNIRRTPCEQQKSVCFCQPTTSRNG